MSEPAPSLPAGFQFSGVACGIKASGKKDVSLIVSERDVVGAGVFTKNQIVAAPVLLCKARTPSETIRAVVTNSGNANACTGQSGMDDAVTMCQQVAAKVGCDESQVLVMSTGVIGQPLPMDKIAVGIEQAHDQLSNDHESFLSAADAILTTDNARKMVQRTVVCGGKSYEIAAMAKGAGMISPNMATMLAVVLTDAPLESTQCQTMLAKAADLSFNRVSVDGHTSTNDTLLLLSSGQGEPLSGEPLQDFVDQLNDLCIELAKKLVADGEGATHVMQVHVHGAADDSAAELIARTVAASPLVKTAITGGDPNWGRIVSAAGYAEAKIDPTKTTLKICGQAIYLEGVPQSFDAAALSKKMKANVDVEIDLQVGLQSGKATFWSSDLTTEYVTFNSEYTT
ncbi:bifunctional glutamate N-acetyltransferase/amino-acid acetyltransferase ArgJ [Planctomycetes bacterium K23_9]|uniref:Arginine biosynthesis bifunctional protein ArgJ n=1 Tax=Stieleria marina TaxID=1930275 RepID=A0A517NZL6_9BACT|nr:Arginine biosynthesis bifunctional protein ArgJ [Planctomycetes bacterium K23_9]